MGKKKQVNIHANHLADKTVLATRKILYAVFFIAAILYLYTFFTLCETTLNSDSAGVILNAVMAFREGSFIPKGFNYSSIVGFQAHVILMPLILLFTSDVLVAFFVANVIMIVITLFAADKLLCALRISKNWRLVFLIVLLLPLSGAIIELQIIAQYYLVQLAGIFFSLYLFLACTDAGRKKTAFLSTVAFVHAFLQSLNGMRFISFFTLPFVGAFCYYCWLTYHQDDWNGFRKCIFKARCVVFCSTVTGALSGFLYFSLKLKKEVSTYSFSLITENDMPLESQKIWNAFIDALYGFFRLTGGVSGGEEMISVIGIVKSIAFVFSVFLIIIFFKSIYHSEKWESDESFIVFFTLFCFLINKFLCAVLPRIFSTDRYDYLPFYVLLIIPIVHIQKFPCILEYVKKSFVNFCFVCLTGLYLLCSPFNVMGDNENLKLQIEQMKDATQWASERGYDFGYATYWNANKATVLSNLQVEFAALYPPPEMLENGFYPWFGGMPRDYYKDDYHEGKTVIVLNKAESEIATGTLPQNYTEKYSNNVFDVYCYADDPFNFEEQLHQYFTPPCEVSNLEN